MAILGFILFLSTILEAGSDFASSQPCCMESLGVRACNILKNHKTLEFKRRCETEVDFAVLQCCHTCGTNVTEVGLRLFAKGDQSKQCFDRHKTDFCRSFVNRRDGWNHNNQMSCTGNGAPLAFRICRKTCGYCNSTIYELNLKDPSCPYIG